MRQSNYNYFILNGLACMCLVVGMVILSGCSDNPEAKAAKELRNQTTKAVKLSVEKKYAEAQDVAKASLSNRSGGLTKDAAYLASGNLALASGRQLQADLGLKTLPLRGNIEKFENVLRESERLLIEKERISKLLESGEKEVNDLRLLLEGNAEKEGLNQQYQTATEQWEQMISQKTLLLNEKDDIQKVLDERQSQADELIRQAELKQGDQRLELEKKAYSILQDRKEYYIKVQDVENEITLLNNEIALAQVKVDGFTRARQETQQRIDEILNAPSRATLQQQLAEIENAMSQNRQRLTEISNEITLGLKTYRQDSDQICDTFQEAISDFQQVGSSDAKFTATLHTADSAYLAALTCSNFIKIHQDTANRLQGLVGSSIEELVSTLQIQLPAASGIDTDYKNKMYASFDQAAQEYESAFSAAASMSNDAKCSIAKSHLLTLHSKMQIADLLEAFDLADSTETAMNALIEKGNELGACFTQSEAMRVVMNEGLNYFPALPLNMEVFMEGKKQELSGWKLLPLEEQETVVDENLVKIDDLIAKYGQDAATQLEPLKQELLAAKEQGFEQPVSGTAFGPGEPNSL